MRGPMNSLPDWERNRRWINRASWVIVACGIALVWIGLWVVTELLKDLLHVLRSNGVKGV